MSDITPTDEQTKAIRLIAIWFKSKPRTPFILGGYAGVGKSTIIPFIVDFLKLEQHQVHFCAYTGKASLVLRKKEMLGATTIHRLVYIPYTDAEGKLKFKRNPAVSNELRLIIVDEASTVDTKLKTDLESYGIPVLYIGDCFQLPPVSKDQTNLMSKPNFILTEVHRQAADNPIIHVAHMIRKNQYVKFGRYGETFLRAKRTKLHDEWLLNASQIICGRNDTRNFLNRQIRRTAGTTEKYPVVGDKLICLKNNHDLGLINGMLGSCEAFDPKTWNLTFKNDDEEVWNYLNIEPDIFADTKIEIKYHKEIDQFDFGYVITCHKAQGSEFDNVLVFEETLGRDEEMHRRWLYTAITRASSRLILIGTDE
jgi:ATP-dependent exoDNAse (exonuclease V) alpha subunit